MNGKALLEMLKKCLIVPEDELETYEYEEEEEEKDIDKYTAEPDSNLDRYLTWLDEDRDKYISFTLYTSDTNLYKYEVPTVELGDDILSASMEISCNIDMLHESLDEVRKSKVVKRYLNSFKYDNSLRLFIRYSVPGYKPGDAHAIRDIEIIGAHNFHMIRYAIYEFINTKIYNNHKKLIYLNTIINEVGIHLNGYENIFEGVNKIGTLDYMSSVLFAPFRDEEYNTIDWFIPYNYIKLLDCWDS